ncbi:hypothetical protein [Nonlabens sp.]|uniref:hypothetical protein n=1 Tax=Nonlabens sp. TaxID=1888209 RepID=UPI0032634278
MKKVFLLLAFITVGLISCEEEAPAVNESNQVSLKSTPINTISLETAQQWANDWRKLEDKSTYIDDVKGWNVPGSDLTQVMAQDDAVDSRMYIGLNDNETKLIIVGVDADGKDMIDASKGWYIYDATEPCPHKCDSESPLF